MIIILSWIELFFSYDSEQTLSFPFFFPWYMSWSTLYPNLIVRHSYVLFPENAVGQSPCCLMTSSISFMTRMVSFRATTILW